MVLDTVPLITWIFKLTLWQCRKIFYCNLFLCLCYQWDNISIYIFIYMKTLIPHRIFRFWNFVLLNQKFRKQKRQCSQKIDLNPSCETLHSWQFMFHQNKPFIPLCRGFFGVWYQKGIMNLAAKVVWFPRVSDVCNNSTTINVIGLHYHPRMR